MQRCGDVRRSRSSHGPGVGGGRSPYWLLASEGVMSPRDRPEILDWICILVECWSPRSASASRAWAPDEVVRKAGGSLRF